METLSRWTGRTHTQLQTISIKYIITMSTIITTITIITITTITTITTISIIIMTITTRATPRDKSFTNLLRETNPLLIYSERQIH